MNKYRHPREYFAMALVFGIIGLFTLVLSFLTFGIGFFLVIGGIVWLYIKVIRKSELDFYTYIDEARDRELVRMVNALAKKWRMGEVEVYLNSTREIKAEPTDFGKDFIILNQGTLDAIPGERHRRFVLGHELGHAGLWHGWLRKLDHYVDHFHADTFIQKAFDLFTQDYLDMIELSADRIGLISCNSLKAAMETVVFVEIGQNDRAYAEIAKAVVYLSSGKSARNRKVKQVFSEHPAVYERIYELTEFAREMKMV